tara:strand:+ start:144 stop:596 length:453 start_codon:yes stop_codon:yes gene_type:complete
MNYKNRGFLLTFILIIIIQTLLYINNTQKTSFRYFIWNIQEIKIGKIIVISFFSGLLVSSVLHNNKNLNPINKYKNNYPDREEDYEDLIEEEEKTEVEPPPQRDIRDTQPTISVNYRVIKNTRDNYSKYDKNNSDNSQYQDDWNSEDSDW